MCGICGKVGLDSAARIEPGLVQQMINRLKHRGPDDTGIYSEPQAVLGHTRLSIIDLNSGKQPITNEDGTIWIVFNGEIYNYRDLRSELLQKGHRFSTQTDTEVIIHLYEEYGPDCVSRLRGMFAFAIWDAPNKTLFLARDRVGIKPLYYALNSTGLAFASEIKALIADPSISREIEPQVVDRFLTYLFTPGAETLLRGIRKLEAGHWLLLKNGTATIRQYWDLQFVPRAANGDFHKTAEELTSLLRQTVRDHMISDVPVGVLLSGGVDSTAMLSFAVQETGHKVNTFTVGFQDKHLIDERPYARLAAQKYGNQHYETTISAQDFRDFIPGYVWHMEEPVFEPPAVALYYVTKLAREHVTVLISGEGGDEAFAGYPFYRNLVWLERFKAMGRPWTTAAGALLGSLGSLPKFGRLGKYSDLMEPPLHKYYFGGSSNPFRHFNRIKNELYSDGFAARVDTHASSALALEMFAKVAGQDRLNQMLYVDTKMWLPDDLLIKADKMTMANSLELRVPLLDHKVLEFAAALPASYKLNGVTTKHILKHAFKGQVPSAILNRKKAGFPVPVQSWLQNELRQFVWDVLTDKRALERGYFNRAVIERLLADTESPEYPAVAFSLVTLELWHRSFIDAHAN
jgi:asparagine synthase (glutamine-hydrolysing)